jgi:hypothetical protein
MEFPFDVQRVLSTFETAQLAYGVVVITAETLRKKQHLA